MVASLNGLAPGVELGPDDLLWLPEDVVGVWQA